jgi:ribosomal protein L32
MTELVIGIIVTIIITWGFAHFYYRKSSTNIPEWAIPFIKDLPKEKPSNEELLRIFQESLESGKVEVDPLLRIVACPKCGESSKNFKRTGFGDDLHSIVVVSCPNCGWSESVEV